MKIAKKTQKREKKLGKFNSSKIKEAVGKLKNTVWIREGGIEI